MSRAIALTCAVVRRPLTALGVVLFDACGARITERNWTFRAPRRSRSAHVLAAALALDEARRLGLTSIDVLCACDVKVASEFGHSGAIFRAMFEAVPDSSVRAAGPRRVADAERVARRALVFAARYGTMDARGFLLAFGDEARVVFGCSLDIHVLFRRISVGGV